MIIWSREKLAALDDVKLANLRANALDRGADDVVALCDEEFSSRPVKASRRRTTRTVGVHEERNAESKAVALLTALAESLQAQYDLTAATAKRLSVGIKGFRAVELLGKNGTAKVGGLRFSGALSIDRYISYRCKLDRVSMGYLLIAGRPIEEARWVVTGTKSILPEGKPISDQITGLSDVDGAFKDVDGYAFNHFDEAAKLFKSAIHLICAPGSR